MAHLALKRRRGNGAAITLVPMIDVLMIMLVFFMVTSTYLNLDMIPAVEQSDAPAAPATAAAPGQVLMVRIAADGTPTVRGRPLPPDAFAAEVAARIAADPQTQVVLLPSGEAPLQGLIAAMDLAAGAGATRIRVIRLEARP